MMNCRLSKFAIATPVLVLLLFVGGETTLAQTAQPAQSSSMFGGRGPGTQVRSNLTGSVVGQGSTFGTSNSTIGLSGQPIGGTLGATGGLTGSATGAQSAAGARIVGRNNAGVFVGNQQVGQQSQSRNSTRPQFGNRPATETGSSFGDTPFGGNSQQQSHRVIRPRQEVAFSFPQRSAQTIETGLSTQFRTLTTRRPDLQNVRVTVDVRGVAVLSGTVNTDEAKRLAAILARLEPGVREVHNELDVASSPAAK